MPAPLPVAGAALPLVGDTIYQRSKERSGWLVGGERE
jgi:hypothetical protein